MHLQTDVQPVWCYIRPQNLASYSILSSDGKFQSSPMSTSTPSTLKLAGLHHLGPMTNGQLFYKSLILLCITQILTCICLAISLKRLFSCLDTCTVKPILNKYLQNVWQTFDTHCQMFVQCQWCVCSDIYFIPLTSSWQSYCISSAKAKVCYSTVPSMLSWVTMISLSYYKWQIYTVSIRFWCLCVRTSLA